MEKDDHMDEDVVIDHIISSIPESRFNEPTHSQATHWADSLVITPANTQQKLQSLSNHSFIDVDVGLGGLEAYDLRNLSQPNLHENDGESGDRNVNEDGSNYEDDSEDNDFVVHQDNSSEGGSDVSLDEEYGNLVDNDDGSCDVLEVFSTSYENFNPLNVSEFIQDDEGFQDNNPQYLMYSNGQMWARNPDGSISFEVGDLFIEKQQYTQALRDYAVQEGFALMKVKNDKQRHTMRCKGQGCTWRIHCSRLADMVSWQIKTLTGSHVCQRMETNLMASRRWVASHLVTDYKANSAITVKSMQDLIMERYGVFVPHYTIRRAKNLLRDMIEGKHEESYARLPEYVEEIVKRNPGSICSCISQGPALNPQFKRIFISFDAMMRGFLKGCRPLIGVDGSFLKGPYKGVLLIAMGLDGNNGQFPIAYAVVEKENSDNWKYFLRALKMCLGEDPTKFTFISDRHKGLIDAFNTIFPENRRRICAIHYYRNFCKLFPGGLMHNLYYTAANAYCEYVHKRAMQKIEQSSKDATAWLLQEPKELWARYSFDPNLKCPDNTTNFVESFNGHIEKFRHKPIMTLLEAIRNKFMNMMHDRFKVAQTWTGKVVPVVKKQLAFNELDSRFCQVNTAGRGEFGVLDGNTTFTVNLNEHHCDCMGWDLSGIPYKHAVRCILRDRGEVESYVDNAYTIERYKKIYDGIMHIFWIERDLPQLRPPPIDPKKPGRPETVRKGEPSVTPKGFSRVTTMRCKKCNLLGHNSRSHKGDDGAFVPKRLRPKALRRAKPGSKRGRGRPKKSRIEDGGSSQLTIEPQVVTDAT